MYLITLLEETEVPSIDGLKKLPPGSYLGASKYVAKDGWQIVVVEGGAGSVGCCQSGRAWKNGNNTLQQIGWLQVIWWRILQKISSMFHGAQRPASKKVAAPKKGR